MNRPEQPKPPASSNPESRQPEIQPSWKPLLWFGGTLILLISLWEVFLELGVNLLELIFDIIEKIWLVLIEAPEELLEDLLTDWMKQHYPHDADYYAEITTAIGLTPIKLVLVVLLIRWLWKHSRDKWIPRALGWVRWRIAQTQLAWQQLPWYYRIVAGLILMGLLLILI